jgi:hypothetical protein
VQQSSTILVKQSVNPAWLSTGLVADMAENVLSLIGVPLHLRVISDEIGNPRRDDIKFASIWIFSWVEMIVDNHGYTASIR